MQPISSFIERLPFHRNWISEFNGRVFIRARAPDFSIWNEAAPNFSPIHQRAMVFNRNIRQRDALFDLGSLADVRQVQIVLCGYDLANPDNGKTKKKDLSVMVFIDLPITLLRFSILRYQIFQGFSALAVKGCKANVFSATNEKGRLYENKSSRFDRLQPRGEIDG